MRFSGLHRPVGSAWYALVVTAQAICVLAATSRAAWSQSGAQVSLDGTQTLVSKDVGSERWSIVYDVATGRTGGVVFYPDGRSPSFVWCSRSGADDSQIILDCYGSAPCDQSPCDASDWSVIATGLSIPTSFLYPPGTGPGGGGGGGAGSCPAYPRPGCGAPPPVSTDFLASVEAGSGQVCFDQLGELNLQPGGDIGQGGLNIQTGPPNRGRIQLTVNGANAQRDIFYVSVFGQNDSAQFLPDGRIVYENASPDQGPGGAVWGRLDGVRAECLQIKYQRLEIEPLCPVTNRIVGSFRVDCFFDDEETRTVQGTFSFIRTR